jgi:putative transcriptional regulator
MTYPELAKKSGLSEETVQSIATRRTYNATLKTIERLCVALRVTPAELLDWR